MFIWFNTFWTQRHFWNLLRFGLCHFYEREFQWLGLKSFIYIWGLNCSVPRCSSLMSAWVQVMVLYLLGNKPLHEPPVTKFVQVIWHHCVVYLALRIHYQTKAELSWMRTPKTDRNFIICKMQLVLFLKYIWKWHFQCSYDSVHTWCWKPMTSLPNTGDLRMEKLEAMRPLLLDK